MLLPTAEAVILRVLMEAYMGHERPARLTRASVAALRLAKWHCWSPIVASYGGARFLCGASLLVAVVV